MCQEFPQKISLQFYHLQIFEEKILRPKYKEVLKRLNNRNFIYHRKYANFRDYYYIFSGCTTTGEENKKPNFDRRTVISSTSEMLSTGKIKC